LKFYSVILFLLLNLVRWSQDWSNIEDLVAPFPDVPVIDVTKAMIEQKYDAVKMHKLSESFYVSVGFESLPESFWEKYFFFMFLLF